MERIKLKHKMSRSPLLISFQRSQRLYEDLTEKAHLNLKRLQLCFFLFVIFFGSIDAKVKADLDIESYYTENSSITATLIISHSHEEVIDANSFKIGGNPLAVQLVKEEPMTTGDLIVSIYKLTLPGQVKGLYAFPAVTFNVNGKNYRTISRTYEVRASTAETPPRPSPLDQNLATSSFPVTPVLKLEAFVDGPQELYPGQQTIVGYRYFYNMSVDITKEETPLLEADGFTKIGDKTFKFADIPGMSVQQVQQKIEANQPGSYVYGPSVVEGRPYRPDNVGKPQFLAPLSSAAQAITITVSPFPEKNKPPSFNGALGKFEWNISLLSPAEVRVGNEIELAIEAKGDGNLETLTLPELCCQPGMSGLFKLSDLPPVGNINGNTKRFIVKLRPLSTSIQALPPLEFSSFDPATHQYIVWHSDPIPLSITPSNEIKEIEFKELSQRPLVPSQMTHEATQPIEIEAIYPLYPKDLHNEPLGTWWSLFLIPFGVAAIIFQLNLAEYLKSIKDLPKKVDSETLFEKGLSAALDSTEQYMLLREAFLHRLTEKKIIPTPVLPLEKLPQTGISGEIRAFLYQKEKLRYAGEKNFSEGGAKFIEDAKALFYKLAATPAEEFEEPKMGEDIAQGKETPEG